MLERIYVRVIALAWRVDFARLFDRQFYISNNPDIPAYIDPLFHFVRYGAFEGRKPHALFDSAYYLERYPDVARAKQNPLIHYLRFGGFEGRQPHPDFDAAFYLASYPDVGSEGFNPLVHFIEHGAAEGRLPHPDFDPEFYLMVNPDVTAAEVNPVLHFAAQGAAEGRLARPTPETEAWPESYLPSAGGSDRVEIGSRAPVDVVIPVYGGVKETIACFESVFSSKCSSSFKVIAVNDASPEPELADYLRQLAGAQKIELIEHAQNRGFVRSVNAGMNAARGDIILLNSDTLVFDGWIDRLVACAHAEDRTGTVTPFSNNGVICSYPVFAADNAMDPSPDLAALDAVFAKVNRGRSVELPTAVGFCMYIRRECLAQTGEFDADTFGLGYGEENDFCMRASAHGWKHRLACDTFVYHAGGTSFGESSARRRTAMQALVKKHPGYPAIVQRHVQADPANAYRIAVTAHRIRSSGKRAFLAVLHRKGGGVTQHVRDLAKATRDRIVWLDLQPLPPRGLILQCSDRGYQFSVRLREGSAHDSLLAIARACGVERIHIHHMLGHRQDLLGLAQDLKVPFDFTIHDYYSICPQITLSDEHGRYCGEPGEDGCNECLVKRPSPDGLSDIYSWRAEHAWTIAGAERVIAPSNDAATRITRYFPSARVFAAGHPGQGPPSLVAPKPISPGEPLRIAVLGAMAIHKGIEILQGCADRARRTQAPIEFVLVGSTEPALKRGALAFRETGPYADDPSEIIGKVAPHLVWFPARCAETFSYTLSTCLDLGLPAAAHDVGAFPERLGGRSWSWILPRTWEAGDWLEFFLRIRTEHFLPGIPPESPPALPQADADFYSQEYLETSRPFAGAPAIKRKTGPPPIRVVAAVATDRRGQIQACGYVRIIRTLTHPSLADTIQLTVASPSRIAACEADVVLVQRTAVQDMGTAERILETCRRRAVPLAFEIDDDLFHIPPEHPEHAAYAEILWPAKWLASCADAVLVSTPYLERQMLPYNRNRIVIPNFLDDQLWIAPPASPRFDSSAIRVLYFGTTSHRDDLELLASAVRSLRPSDRNRLRIEVIGLRAAEGPPFEATPVPHHIAVSFPRFVKWLQDRNTWNWGVAPLLDAPFNRSKTPLKFLEYSALGLPAVCSDTVVYSDLVQSSSAGLLAVNTREGWREALERILSDRELWRRLRENCPRIATANSIFTNAETIRIIWNGLAGRPHAGAGEVRAQSAV